MVKVQLNVRVNPFVLRVLNELSQNQSNNKTTIVETAIKEFFERNRDEIRSPDLLRQLDYLKMEDARNGTKLEMRKATFQQNAIRRLKKMLRDGISKDNFLRLIQVWSNEAEATGVDRVEFLELVRKELQQTQGSGINEV